MRALCLICLLFFAQPLISGFAPPDQEKAKGDAITELSAAMKRRIKDSCFEVVVLKPEKDSLTYEKELPWEQVPFAVRNDKYISIGTAFSVSGTELLTAFHVLDLDKELLSYPRFFIRDSQQRVFEIDQILRAHEHRDVARFTVKGRTFNQWLEMEPRVEMNRPVFTAGNAYGEGVVVRRGDLIGTFPEPMDGAFSWLKSSADVNDGNSGGPLLDRHGRVIGLVVQRKDNLSYSLPTSEIASLNSERASFYNKIIYAFDLFPEKSNLVPSAFEIPLPTGYRELKHQAQRIRQERYNENMAALFAGLKDLFPAGASSAEAIHQVPTSSFLEVIFKDPNSSRWTISDVEVNKFNLNDSGMLRVAKSSNLALIGIRKPSSLNYSDLIEKPRVSMDLVFQGLNIPREIGAEKVRITSLGEPMRIEDHRDRWGRPWRIAAWHLEFDDRVLFLCSTPVPEGMLAVLTDSPSSSIDNWFFDLKKITDNLCVPYIGRVKEWLSFLDQSPERLPHSFKDLRLAFKAGESLQLRSPWVDLDLDRRVFSLSAEDVLGFYMGFERSGEKILWGLRRMVYSEDESDSYFVWAHHLKPEAGMDEQASKGWREIAENRSPYDRKIMIKEGRTDIATVLKSFVPKGIPFQEAAGLFTLYLGRTGTASKGAMSKYLDAVARGFKPAGAGQ